jgi:phenylalanyl-tRNA synthetase beta chain
MATFTFDIKDFNKLVGKNLSIEFLREKLPLMGLEWDSDSGDEITADIFPNRPDMLCVEGLARAFSGFIGLKKGLPDYRVEKSGLKVRVDSKVKKARPFIVCAVVRGIRFTDDFITSLMQLQEKIHVTHGRKRSKVAIGVHDMAPIREPIVYTTVDRKFKFKPLDWAEEADIKTILEHHPKGIEYSHLVSDNCPIIFSDERVISFPPIINSELTRVKPETTDIFVDVTGSDFEAVKKALNIVVAAMADRGAKIYSVEIDYGNKKHITPDLRPEKIKVDLDYINKTLGLKLSSNQAKEFLSMMRLGSTSEGEKINVMVPAYRVDILHPIDIVEDIAIAYGYDKFEPEIPNIATIGDEDPIELFSDKMRQFIVGFGFQEVMTYILTNKERLIDKMNMKSSDFAEIKNPKTTDFTVCRNCLIPNLIHVLQKNKHRGYPQEIFELDDCIELAETDTGTKDVRKLAIMSAGTESTFTRMKQVLQSIFMNLDKKFTLRQINHPSFIPGRVANIICNGKNIGIIGEIHPQVLENWELTVPVAAMELYVEEIMN